ncbi:MAG: haeIIIM [Solirubrobacterales bacterium]|nr:haeIIIM [Solirubrobacterales bacterium]
MGAAHFLQHMKHGLRLPPARPVAFRRVARYRLIDLFAGCGAMSRGFVDSGRFEPIFAVESDPRPAETYAKNFPSADLEVRPIQQVDAFPAADVVIGGPPCQGFSTLNRDGADVASRRLWQEYLRGLTASRPAVFVMENVPQILDSPEYHEFADSVEGSGLYQLDERVLNVADYGVAQRRLRAFVIGTVLDEVPWPAQTHADPALNDPRYLPWKTFNQAVRGLPRKPSGRAWHRDRKPRPESVVRYEAVPAGGNRFDMERVLDERGLGHLVPPCWRKHRTGSYDVFGRLWGDRPATTIRTEFHKPEKGRYLHPVEHRAITVREAARLMSFPDDFILLNDQPMTAVARQVGNAVPPLMAQRIAEAIALALDAGQAAPVLELVA